MFYSLGLFLFFLLILWRTAYIFNREEPDLHSVVSEKAMAPHSSTLAWKIPWAEEPGRLQSMGSLRVGYDWATSLSRIREGNGNPLQCSCLENPRDGGARWAAVYGVAHSRTRLKWLSSSSSRSDYSKWERLPYVGLKIKSLTFLFIYLCFGHTSWLVGS